MWWSLLKLCVPGPSQISDTVQLIPFYCTAQILIVWALWSLTMMAPGYFQSWTPDHYNMLHLLPSNVGLKTQKKVKHSLVVQWVILRTLRQTSLSILKLAHLFTIWLVTCVHNVVGTFSYKSGHSVSCKADPLAYMYCKASLYCQLFLPFWHFGSLALILWWVLYPLYIPIPTILYVFMGLFAVKGKSFGPLQGRTFSPVQNYNTFNPSLVWHLWVQQPM